MVPVASAPEESTKVFVANTLATVAVPVLGHDVDTPGELAPAVLEELLPVTLSVLKLGPMHEVKHMAQITVLITII